MNLLIIAIEIIVLSGIKVTANQARQSPYKILSEVFG